MKLYLYIQGVFIQRNRKVNLCITCWPDLTGGTSDHPPELALGKGLTV
jgi:hypothetical protein